MFFWFSNLFSNPLKAFLASAKGFDVSIAAKAALSLANCAFAASASFFAALAALPPLIALKILRRLQ